MSDTTETATEVVADVAEEVAEQATHIAEVSRGLSKQALRFGFGGFVVGAGLSGAATYFFVKRKLEKKYSEAAAEEVAEMAKHYRDKAAALDGTAAKGEKTVEDIVRDKGYHRSTPTESERSAQPPMAVTPPEAVVDAAAEERQEPTRPAPPVPVPEARNAFQEFGDDSKKPGEWDYHKERRNRSPVRPYVIHIDERDETPYEGVMYTYFEEDDVLLNEREEIMDAGDRERVVGEGNLERFGHGSDDPNCVYIRNDQLSMVIEITKTANSYAREMGIEDPEPELRHSHQRRERRTFHDD